jgi:ABC-type amino acid transport substrate-binding protein
VGRGVSADFTYLVPTGSSIRTVADADQPGVRIAVVRNGSSDLALSRMLQRAELIRTGTEVAAAELAAFNLLRSGKADGLAGRSLSIGMRQSGLEFSE